MKVQIEIGTYCNFTCFYCTGRSMDQTFLPVSRVSEVLDDLPPGVHDVRLQGEGEPLLHPHFYEMAEIVRARGHLVNTITNASKNFDAAKIASSLDSISISIDTVDVELATSIGRLHLPTVLKNFHDLVQVMGPSRITVLTCDFGQPLQEVGRMVRQSGCEQILLRLNPKDDYKVVYPSNYVRVGLNMVNAVDKPHVVETVQPPKYHYNCHHIKNLDFRCYGASGSFRPCCYIKDTSKFVSVDHIRDSLTNKVVPECCTGCVQIC